MILKNNSDITDVKHGIIAHGVNCQQVMGSGVAKALYTKWPIIKEKYLQTVGCLGFIDGIEVSYSIIVYNLYTQEYYGKDGKKYADLESIEHCLIDLIFDNSGTTKFNIPKIGCGLGGLDWSDVKNLIEKLENRYLVTFIVHSL